MNHGKAMIVVHESGLFIGRNESTEVSSIFEIGYGKRNLSQKLGMVTGTFSPTPLTKDTAVGNFSNCSVSIGLNGIYFCLEGKLFSVCRDFPEARMRTLPRENVMIVSVSCGERHIFVISEECVLLCRGSNFRGQLGLGSMIDYQKEFVEIFDAGLVTEVSCGANFTYVISQDGSVYATGENTYFQIGSPHTTILEIIGKEGREFHSYYCNLKTTEIVQLAKIRNEQPELLLMNESAKEDKTAEEYLGFYDLCTFQKRDFFPPYQLAQISCGIDRVLFLTQQGKAYDMGIAVAYTKIEEPMLPKEIQNIDKVVKVSAAGMRGISILLHENEGFTISIPLMRRKHSLHAYGGRTEQRYIETKNINIVDVSQGFSAYFFLLADTEGCLYTWHTIDSQISYHSECPILLSTYKQRHGKSARNTIDEIKIRQKNKA